MASSSDSRNPVAPSVRPSIGFEAEFCIAVLKPGKTNPLKDSRQVTDIDTPQPFHPPWPFQPWEYSEWCIPGRHDYNSHDRVRLTIAHALQEAGLPSTAYIEMIREEIYGPEWRREEQWWVDDDASIDTPFEYSNYFNWYSVEINSPAYVYCPEALIAIKCAVETLTSRFLINSNSSCGLHVHTGNGTAGFSVSTLRDLMSFLWCFEPQILTIHPRHRFDNLYSRSLRENAPLVRTFSSHPEWDPLTTLTAMKALRGCKTINEVLAMVDGKGMTYSPSYRVVQLGEWASGEPKRPFKRTVEFRQHAATLDSARIFNWITTILGIVELIRDTCDTHWLHSFLDDQAITDAPLNIVKLLQIMGLPEQAEFYRKNPGTAFGEHGRIEALEDEEDQIPIWKPREGLDLDEDSMAGDVDLETIESIEEFYGDPMETLQGVLGDLGDLVEPWEKL